jgi:hypothetical protein
VETALFHFRAFSPWRIMRGSSMARCGVIRPMIVPVRFVTAREEEALRAGESEMRDDPAESLVQ